MSFTQIPGVVNALASRGSADDEELSGFLHLNHRGKKVALREAHPLTLPSKNLEGEIVQIWELKGILFASIQKGEEMQLVPGKRIFNALQMPY